MPENEFITLAQFEQSIQAHVLKTKLESEGIEVFLRDENTINMNWLYSQALGGVRLQVRKKDLEQAQKILNAPEPNARQSS